MAKIPRINPGDRPSAVVGGGYPTPAEVAAPFKSGADLVDVGSRIAMDSAEKEALRLRAATEAKQAIVNEVAASRAAGDYEEALVGVFEKFKTEFSEMPDQLPEALLAQGRALADRSILGAANSAEGLERAQRTAARLDSTMRQAHEWVVRRQTQKIKADTEGEKNSLAAQATRLGSARELEASIGAAFEKLTGRFEAIYGADAEKEKHDLASRMTEGYVRGQMKDRPIAVKWELENADPEGPLGRFLKPAERATLIEQSKVSIDRRGREWQYDALLNAAGKNKEAVALLNIGQLDAQTSMDLRTANQKALEAARIDPSYTPEQRARQVKFYEGQAKVLDAVEDIRLRGREYDPVEQSDADETARLDTDKALKKYRGGREILPALVKQMDDLVLKRHSGAITEGVFRAQHDRVKMAYEKAVKAEAGNTGLSPFGWELWVDAQESGNLQMNKLMTLAVNVPKSQKFEAWTEYQRRLNKAETEAEKAGRGVTSAEAKRIARIAFSYKTSIDKRLPGDDE